MPGRAVRGAAALLLLAACHTTAVTPVGPSPTPQGPSQTAAEAKRDGVPLTIAKMTLDERTKLDVDVASSVTTDEGVWRLARPIILELTASELVVSNYDGRGKTRKMPRDRVYSIKYVPHARNLVVRIRGIEMFECHLEIPEAEIERIAAFLRLAIGLDSSTEGQHE